jgi:hypothetical protein
MHIDLRKNQNAWECNAGGLGCGVYATPLLVITTYFYETNNKQIGDNMNRNRLKYIYKFIGIADTRNVYDITYYIYIHKKTKNIIYTRNLLY